LHIIGSASDITIVRGLLLLYCSSNSYGTCGIYPYSTILEIIPMSTLTGATVKCGRVRRLYLSTRYLLVEYAHSGAAAVEVPGLIVFYESIIIMIIIKLIRGISFAV
jgi:hypothetical protein